MRRNIRDAFRKSAAKLVLLLFFFGSLASDANAQFLTLETDRMRLIYYGISHEYLIKHVGRTFENSLSFQRGLFDYTPSEKITVIVFDQHDYYNASATVIPRNRVTIRIAPADYTLETLPSAERINSAMHHELMHVVTGDMASSSDKVFRTLFAGKVTPNSEDPVSILYSYLTAPRWFAPRWYIEGVAVFMETWMAGGFGRALGGYDEMVFRTKVRDDDSMFDMVGLESEGTAIDFRTGSNSYLYGTRFLSYLAYTFGPEKVIEWISRAPGSKGYLNSAFSDAFDLPINTAWSDWIEWEKKFQQQNLTRIRSNATTEYRALSSRPLGSVSRGRYDSENRILYVAVNYPGQLAHVLAIDVDSGEMNKITDLKGARKYSVSSLALDPSSQTLFYTTDDDTGWRDLRSVDLQTGRSQMLIEDSRVGDLAFNRSDNSIWGVRHHLGISSLVTIAHPYDDWDLVYRFPYGRDLYDIDISPDGKYLTGALAEINGQQALIRMETANLLNGDQDYETLFSFDISNPEGFAYTPDGKHMYGSSYYSGVSNIYRYDFESEQMEIVTNAETGFFRPSPVSNDSLIVFRYSDQGFTPAMISSASADAVSSIRFLGQELQEKHPVVTEWKAGAPGSVNLDSLLNFEGRYDALGNVGVESIYPIVQGYKDYVAFGLRMNLSDFINLHSLRLTTTYSPSQTLSKDERFHASLQYRYINWTLRGAYNETDFYDLFGPSKTSRKGYGVGLQYRKTLLFDNPRSLVLTIAADAYGGLERLPGYQNVASSSKELYTSETTLKFEHLTNSLGGINKEKGISWSLHAGANYVNEEIFPRVSADYHLGIPLPIGHSSLWLHGSAGKSFGGISEPAANFYFGGFRNNWVDDQDEKQYHEAIAFPGLEIDEIGGSNYAKVMTELVLPPLRFRRFGGTNVFLKWIRLSVFSGGLFTNLDREFDEEGDFKLHRAINAGGQIDLRVMFFSYFRTTLSFGYAVAREKDGKNQYETMVSLKIL